MAGWKDFGGIAQEIGGEEIGGNEVPVEVTSWKESALVKDAAEVASSL